MTKKTATTREQYMNENAWWYVFYNTAGSLKWDDSVAFADQLRQEGYSPEETAHKTLVYDQDLY